MLILAFAAAMLVSATTMADSPAGNKAAYLDIRTAKQDQRKAEARDAELTKTFAAMKKRCEIAEEKASKLTRALATTKAELREARAAAAKNDKKTNETSSPESSKAASGQGQN